MNPFDPEAPRTPFGVKPPQRYSTFLPFLIVLFTLIGSTAKDIVILHHRKVALIVENARNAEPLVNAGKEADFVEKIHKDLEQLALTDPAAARILADFFPTHAEPPQVVPDSGAKPASSAQ